MKKLFLYLLLVFAGINAIDDVAYVPGGVQQNPHARLFYKIRQKNRKPYLAQYHKRRSLGFPDNNRYLLNATFGQGGMVEVPIVGRIKDFKITPNRNGSITVTNKNTDESVTYSRYGELED